MSNKTIYTFKISKTKEVEKPVETVGEDNVKTIRYEKVSEPVEKEYAIKKPGRSLYDAAEVFFTIENSRMMKAGILSQAQMKNLMEETGSLLSKEDEKIFQGSLEKVKALKTEFDALTAEKVNAEEDRKVVIGTRTADIDVEMNVERRVMDNIYLSQAKMFDNCSESKARQRTISLWILNLAQKKVGEDFVDIFTQKPDFNERLTDYDNILEGADEFLREAVLRITKLVVNWYYAGMLLTQEQFKAIDGEFIA